MQNSKRKPYLYFIPFIFLTIILLPTQAAPAQATSNFDRIDQFITRKMKAYHIPGLSLGLVKKDKIYYLKGYGSADPFGTPITPQTPFILGSVSKSFTGLAIMQLVEQGKIALDQPVQTYLPWFTLADPRVAKQITIGHLLSHTSGISTYAGREVLTGTENRALKQVIHSLKNLKTTTPVGSGFQYSNLNYLILGEVIETVSGIPYETYIEQNIFTPLEMKHSYTSRQMALKNGLATGFQPILGWMAPTYPPFHQDAVPAGYLISCAEDLTHYLIAQINGGRYQEIAVLSPQGIRQTHSAVSETVPYYGMGWFLSNIMTLHPGDIENFHADIRLIKHDDWGIVLLYNANDNFAPAVLNKSAYDEIGDGVINILTGFKLLPENDLSGKLRTAYLVMNMLVLLISLSIIWGIRRLWGWRRYFKTSFTYLLSRLIWLISFNFLLPYLLYTLIPKIFSASWSLVLLYTPGLGHVLITLPMILCGFGLAKIGLMIYWIRKNHNTSKPTALL
ncbi:MAG TPA: serine hydrolase domain-containing protein [Bacillota bacterium]|nr:serine hydrolase domain-containing protein [Bacillota bacterium]